MTRWGLQTTTTVVDDFNRANEATLASPWSAWYGSGLSLVSNQAEPPPEGWGGSARLGDVFADGEVFVTITSFVGFAATDLYLRMLPDFAGGYSLGIDASLLILWRADLIGAPILDQVDHTPTAGNRYKLRAAGDQISVYVDSGSGWEEVMEVTDTAYPGEGFVAVDAYLGVKLDNYGGGELAPSLWAPDTDDRWDLTLA